MIVPISEKTRIRSDKYNWTVEHFKGIDKEGQDVWRGDTYHGSFVSAVQTSCDRDIRLISNTVPVTEAIELVRGLVEFYRGVLEFTPNDKGEE